MASEGATASSNLELLNLRNHLEAFVCTNKLLFAFLLW